MEGAQDTAQVPIGITKKWKESYAIFYLQVAVMVSTGPDMWQLYRLPFQWWLFMCDWISSNRPLPTIFELMMLYTPYLGENIRAAISHNYQESLISFHAAAGAGASAASYDST